MRKNFKKKAVMVAMIATLAVGSVAVSGKNQDTNSIGKLKFLEKKDEGYTKATAKTTISSAATPQHGYAASAKVTTTNEEGVVKSVTTTKAESYVYASRSASKGHHFVRATGLHKQLYNGAIVLKSSTAVNATK